MPNLTPVTCKNTALSVSIQIVITTCDDRVDIFQVFVQLSRIMNKSLPPPKKDTGTLFSTADLSLSLFIDLQYHEVKMSKRVPKAGGYFRNRSITKKNSSAWNKRLQNTMEHRVLRATAKRGAPADKNMDGGVRGVVVKNPRVARNVNDMKSGKWVGRKLVEKELQGSRKLGEQLYQTACEMPIIRVDGSCLKPKRRMNKTKSVLKRTIGHDAFTYPSLPQGIFKERKQSWSLSRDAKIILEKCQVSHKRLFLAKCQEHFSGAKH